MNFLWPNDIQYERVLLFVTDAASYDQMICLAHGLTRVAETSRANFPLVDKLVSFVNMVFFKASYRK
jgi:hypothetical protein